MADTNFGLAGFKFNPQAVNKFGWDKKLPTNLMPGLKIPAGGFPSVPSQPNSILNSDPGLAIIEKALDASKKYASAPVDTSKMTPEDRSVYAVTSALRPDMQQTVASFLMNRAGAKEANEMQLANYKYLAEEARKKENRRYNREQLGNLITSIGSAFSPISSEQRQQAAADVANIMSPKNLGYQQPIQAAPYGLQTRQYFT